jgi:hypothetical protein
MVIPKMGVSLKMKRKIILVILSFGLIINIILPFHKVDAKEITNVGIILNGQSVQFDVMPVVKNGRVLVPFRALFEKIEANVYWNSKEGTVIASKNGKDIKLKVNSGIAFVNGQKNTLDVPATIIKGRVLVPIRFVAENYDGLVQWDGSKKRVIITSDKIETDNGIPVYVNNKLLTLSSPAVKKSNKIYVPLESFVTQIGDDIEYSNNNENIFIDLEGASIILFLNKDLVMINGNYSMLGDYPILINGIVYAPARYIVDLFGGSIQIAPGASEVRININHTNLRSEFLEKENVRIAKPIPVPSANYYGNRRLLVSDNPEVLNHDTFIFPSGTLAEDIVHTSEQSLDHRIYGWHLNKLGRHVTIGITIENLSDTNTLEVINVKGIDRSSSNSWATNDVGLPLAEALLSNKLGTINPESSVVNPKETVVINSLGVGNDFLIGFLKDFTIRKASGTGEMSYKVRVVLTQVNEPLSNITMGLVAPDMANPHPRGVWKSSQLIAELPAYITGGNEVSYNISNGSTDNLFSKELSLGETKEFTIQNPGHFGATYIVKIPFLNYFGQSKTVRVRVGARGGMYNGAVKVNGKVYMIPVLRPFEEAAKVIDYQVEGSNSQLELEFMHAGGGNLPLAINLSTIE